MQMSVEIRATTIIQMFDSLFIGECRQLLISASDKSSFFFLLFLLVIGKSFPRGIYRESPSKKHFYLSSTVNVRDLFLVAPVQRLQLDQA